jgi:hypothetical protein
MLIPNYLNSALWKFLKIFFGVSFCQNSRDTHPQAQTKVTIMPALIHLYSTPTPNGQKVHIFLEEAQIQYEAHPINISVGEQFHPEFLKISPNNKIPAIVDKECKPTFDQFMNSFATI